MLSLDVLGLALPGDIGPFGAIGSTKVFKFTFSGETWVTAMSMTERRWILLDCRPYTGANATLTIAVATAALQAGRTWKEGVLIIGDYEDLDQIELPSYIELNIQGYLKAKDGLDDHLITNDDVGGGNTDITIIGGHVDANKENQAADMSTIHLENVIRPEIYRVRVRGGNRPVGADSGEGICLWDCHHGKVVANYCYEAFYDNIKIRGGSTHCLVALNTCKDSETKGGIQVSSTTTAHINVIGNTIDQNAHALDNGIRIHAADHVLVEGNEIYCYQSASIQLIDQADNCTIIANTIFTNANGIHAFSGATGSQKTTIKDNTIFIATNVASIGIHLAEGNYCEIKNNTIHGQALTTGIEFDAGCDYNRLGPNTFYNCGTNITIPDDVDIEFIDCQIFNGSTYSETGAGAFTKYGVHNGKASIQADESMERQIPAKAGIFRNAYFRLNGAPGAGDTSTLTYRNEAADTPVTVQIAGGAAVSGSDRAHGFTCDPLDRLAVKLVWSAGAATNHAWWSIQFLPFEA